MLFVFVELTFLSALLPMDDPFLARSDNRCARRSHRLFGQGINRQQQDASFFVREVEDFDVDLHVRVHVAAKVAVDELELSVRQLVGEQAAGEANLLVKSAERGALVLGVEAVIQLVRDQVAGADLAVALDAIADLLIAAATSSSHRGHRALCDLIKLLHSFPMFDILPD
jgi:hypothetical protein